jgi:hypothetical protein
MSFEDPSGMRWIQDEIFRNNSRFKYYSKNSRNIGIRFDRMKVDTRYIEKPDPTFLMV